jgi:pimeloyl-ACP methyl ester carboxylesterase
MTDLLEVNGVALECARWPGTRPGPTLVLLHEGLGCVSMWRGFPAQLAEATGLPVFAWSRAGYGRSAPIELPRPLDFIAREAHTTVGPLLDAAGIADCVLVGHSDGASIALVYAGTAADPRVRAVAVMAPHVLTETKTVMNIAETKRVFESTDLRAKLARHHGDNVDCAFWGWCDAWLDAGFAYWNIEAALDGIAVPVLAIRGNDDAYNTSVHVASIARRVRGPVTRLDLEACGHAPHLEQPDAVRDAIATFVRKLR